MNPSPSVTATAAAQPPKVVVFDLGKVLIDFDYSLASRRISEKGNASIDQVRTILLETDLLYRFETGALSASGFFDQVKERTGYRGDFEEFQRGFADIFQPIPDMIQLHATLRSRGVPVFIFSNTNNIAVPHIRETYPFFAHFNGYVLSYEHGAMKPEAKLYEVVERVTGCRGAKILYIDDRAENIEAGARRGWQVILQEEPTRTIAQVKARGLIS